MPNTVKLTVASLAIAIVASAHARATGFDVRPITIETHDGLGLVVVTNPSDKRIYLESQVLDWSEDANGQEHTVESTTAVASPPAMWVPPHSNYTIRIRLPAGAPGREQSYRVVIRQLPERNDVAAGRIVFALTQNLPAFFIPANPASPSLSAHLTDPRHLMVANNGGRRVRITELRQNGRVLASGLLGYALANGSLAMTVAQPIQPGSIELETDVGRQTIGIR